MIRDKMSSESYYLLTLAAIAQEIKQRSEKKIVSITLATDFF